MQALDTLGLVGDARDVECTHDRQHRSAARTKERAKHSVPAARAHDPLDRAAKIAGSDNWLYDQENFTGNELCLYGSGGYQCAAMSSFPRGSGGNWQFEVYSYWTGNETGYFTDGDINCPGAGWSTYTEYPGGAANCSYGICFSD
jgi:hypothetical protein